MVVSVSVPLCVDILDRGDVDSLGKLVVRLGVLLLGRRCDSGSSHFDVGSVGVFVGSRGGSRLGSGVLCQLAGAGGRLCRRLRLARRRAVVARGRLSTAHVEVHALVEVAGLGLNVVGKDVRNLVARSLIVASQDRTEGVGRRGDVYSVLATGLEVVSVLPCRAVATKTIDI